MDRPFTQGHAAPAQDGDATPRARLAQGGLAAALRVVGMLVVATFAILVMLLAMAAAQPTFLG